VADPVNLRYDDVQLVRRFTRTEKQMVYGVVNALNATAKRVQLAEFENVRKRFQIRKPEFFFGTADRPGGVAARISPFASVKDGRLYAEVSVSAGSQAAQRRTLLGEFEQGGQRRPFTPGAAHVAVPIVGRPARPSISRPVPPAFTFAGLHFLPFRGGKRVRRKRIGGKLVDVGGTQPVQFRGRERTFIAKTPREPEGGVFQRFGPGRGDIREIYAFRRPFRLDTRLHWIETARATADAWLHEEMERQAVDIIKHNAGKQA
jgi:hypothetical protein